MDSIQEAWNADYARRGRRWARDSSGLPAFLPHERVLEAGCGDGKTLRALTGSRKSLIKGVSESPEIVALDFSRAAIRLSAPEFSRSPRVHLLCADAARMPFHDASFDAVLLLHVLGHAALVSRSKICSEVQRVIRPGGSAILRVFSTGDFRFGKGEEIEDQTFLRGDGTFTHYFSSAEIPDLFPFLSLVSMDTISWTLRVRGRDLQREEIHAVFRAE
ncbi:MAG: class I SAM-dependent methyltransferase [Methanolinea sp.]|jgi:ubiquinone/menaquinone biosynthesis C-methylase UbiE|nr:class I SAM-dependent methyltransferase [Methanolinea sp.]